MGYKGKSVNAPKYAVKQPVIVDLHGMCAREAVQEVSTCLSAAHAGEIYHIVVGKGRTRGVSVLGACDQAAAVSLWICMAACSTCGWW
jgi:DNA-nicking Smr family endonuclease